MELLILTLLFLTVTCEEKVNKNETLCNGTVTNTHGQIITDIDAVCGPSTPCFLKCCEVDELLYFEKIDSVSVKHCLHRDKIETKLKENVTDFNYDSIQDYSDFEIFDKDILRKKETTNKSLNDFKIVVNKQLVNKGCGSSSRINEHNIIMLEDGRFVMLIPNTYDRVKAKKITEYCIEKMVNPKILKRFPKGMYVYYTKDIVANEDSEEEHNKRSIFTGVAMIISAVFLLLVLLVYSLLKQLRNIQGMVLMAYVTTLAIGYLLKAVQLIGVAMYNFNGERCQKLGPAYYAFFLSSFFWLNIMSFDIWWTFRGFRKVRTIHRQGELVKFMWYGLYAWGVPALLTTIVYCLDTVIDLKNHPEIVTPHFKHCFHDQAETMLYLHAPILIMTVFNTLLSFMTIYNIWLINNGIANFDHTKKCTNQNNRNRFCLYIKISALMGVSWIMELLNQISTTSYENWLFILLNIYNMLIGVAIFFMFVFKMSIFKKLCDRFNINTRFNKPDRNSEYSKSGKSSTKARNDNCDTIDESKIGKQKSKN